MPDSVLLAPAAPCDCEEIRAAITLTAARAVSECILIILIEIIGQYATGLVQLHTRRPSRV